jgi:flagellar biosynthesis/type III secretory pathway protein FliH
MNSTNRGLAEQLGDLLRCRPADDAPEHVKTAWLEQKRELLAAIETGIVPSMSDTDKTREIQDKAVDKLMAVVDEGYEEGYAAGYEEGYEAGRDDVLAEAKA